MKILQICPKPPWPPIDGGCIAMKNITEGLQANHHKTDLLVASTDKHPYNRSEIPANFQNGAIIKSAHLNTRVQPLPALIHLFTGRSYNITRFYSREFENTMTNMLDKTRYDIVQLEGLSMASYIPAIRSNSTAKVVLRSHNVEFEIWGKIAENEAHILRKQYIESLTRSLRKFEIRAMNKYDGVACIAPHDMSRYRELGCKLPMEDIPFGIDVKEYRMRRDEFAAAKGNALFHIGAMDWMPNLEGIQWFLKHLWPAISNQHPALQFHLAGRKMPRNMIGNGPKNVTIQGEVKDAKDFMLSNGIMVVPLLSGGGLRVKIIEAMALGKTIITTPTGAQGINCKHDENILIGNTANEFVELVNRCIREPGWADEIGQNAADLAMNYYDNQKITTKLITFYNKLLAA